MDVVRVEVGVGETDVADRAERRILTGLRARRRDAYATVIESHYGSVYRLLLLLTRDADRAADLTQEVFASAWAGLASFRGESSLRTWLHRIAYHCFVDAQRRRARERALAGGRNETPAAGVADPLSRLVADEHLGRMYRALEKLDDDERAVLLLHYMNGLSYREMAEVLHQPGGTVKWLVHRAVEKLRRQLGEQVER